ncbi:MAG: adenosylcobinamide-GDP ribazoletransferase [Nitrospiraceae bacterium]|nr:adenosylcobinamide-GDP ribazoletransferase [Nitrospiraceae bacterium]
MRQLLLAFQFLTIMPIRVKGDISEKEIAQSAAFFPLAGAFQGLIAILSAFLLLQIFPPEITSGLIILILIISNGGFHLDGLADTFDAIAVKSTGDRETDMERRLSVMKDSTAGAIGVTALVVTILMKYLLISSMLHNYSLFTVYCLLFLMPVFSKWTMIIAMYHGTSARQDGLGKIFLNNVRINTVIFSSLLITVLYISVAELHLLKVYGANSTAVFVVLSVLLYIFSLASVRFCIKKFGGLTGDNLGAISEISEILFLMVATVWLQHYI